MNLAIDIETYSEVELDECGVHRYAEDPSFDVLLFAFSWGDDPVTVIDFTAGEELPDDVRAALTDPAVTKTAWNAAFERTCLARYLSCDMPASQWEDTMVLAAVCGLPMKLGEAGSALRLGEAMEKDKDGKALLRWFCKPRKPTKKNPSTRNLPADFPDKWDKFKAYNAQDVVAERAIRDALHRWAPNAQEHEAWVMDQEINDRGVRVDLDLARNAVAFNDRYKAELTGRAIALTGMENPNSVSQIKTWLREQEGVEVPSLNKKVVADVVAGLTTDRAREFMALRSELAKSSTAKYAAVLRSVNKDCHVRGCFQFYGASRTGRWAGRRLQLQNLSKNKMPDIDACRELVRVGDYEGTELLYGKVTSCLSELVRTVLIPEPGHRFIVCDYSAIEARVLAWIAGEEWALDEFRGDGLIYEATGAMMFHVPKDTIAKGGVNNHRRQPAKTAVLACVAGGQLVLTDRGPVPIEKITRNDRVWDGVEWVAHDGLVRRGKRSTVQVNGVWLTPDHRILTEKGMVACGKAEGLDWASVRVPGGFEDRRTSAQRERTGNPYVGVPVRLRYREGNFRGALDKKKEADEVLRVQEQRAGRIRAHESWNVENRSVQHMEPDARALPEPEGQELGPVRRKGHIGLRALGEQFSGFLRRHGWFLRTRPATGEDRQRERVLPGKLYLGDPERTGEKQAEQHNRGLSLGKDGAFRAVRPYKDSVLNPPDTILPGKTVAIRRGDRECETFDLLNAGPRHRFCLVDGETGALRCVSNCGYGGGVNALIAFGADKMGMSHEDMVQTVDLWRQANGKAVDLWRDLERAAVRCVAHETQTVSRTGGIRFYYQSGILWMQLPSGRKIAYFGARYEESRWKPGRRVLSYMGKPQDNKGSWTRLETWGGKLTENLVQATARDFLRDAMLSLRGNGFRIVAHIHDEVIISEPIGGRSLEDVAAIMGTPPPWAPDMPLRGDGYYCPYYIKD